MKHVEFRVERRHDPGSLERLAAMLNRALQGPMMTVDTIQWELSGDEGHLQFQFPIGPGPGAKKNTCEQVGRVLAEFTLTDHEPQLLRRLIQERCAPHDEMEMDALIAETVALLDGEPEIGVLWPVQGRERRLRKLAESYADYLAKHNRLHLDGFIRFRLGEYRREVLEAVDNVIEDNITEQQYEAFMAMLRSMVNWQQTGIPTVHVLHAGGHAFRLLDEDMRPLEREEPHGDASDEEEESLLVSRLLAVSPGQLYIHTPEPDSQVIRTLIGIFGERAALYPHHT